VSDSPIFDWVCRALEEATALSAIEARGTVRIALKKSGVTSAGVTPAQMQVVLKRVLPEELARRGCADADGVCTGLAQGLMEQHFDTVRSGESPEDVFARLGA